MSYQSHLFTSKFLDIKEQVKTKQTQKQNTIIKIDMLHFQLNISTQLGVRIQLD